MKEYTIHFFLDNQTIVEYRIVAKNIDIAEDEAFKLFRESGIDGRIRYGRTTAS